MHLRGRAFIRVGRQWTLRGHLPDPDNSGGRRAGGAARPRASDHPGPEVAQAVEQLRGGWMESCSEWFRRSSLSWEGTRAAFLTLCDRRGSFFFFFCHGTAALAAKTEVAGMRISISNLPMSPGQPRKVHVGGRGSGLPSLGPTLASTSLRWGGKKSLLLTTKRKHVAPGSCDCSCRWLFRAR